MAETDETAPLSRPDPEIQTWKIPTNGIALRLFLTCWLIYSVHFATNIVREIYPALALGDHLSFRLDEYAGLHPDIFEKPGYGWHINNNPGVSFVAAVPYTIFRPGINWVVERTNQARVSAGQTEPPQYASPWPLARQFYTEAWRRGYDVKFAMAAMVMQMLCMAPVSAFSAVVIFYVMRSIFRVDRTALCLALLYAFGTPVFFRTGTLNQNLMLGLISFFGFIILWNPDGIINLHSHWRYLLAGLAGGMAVLFDYSGVVFLVGLFIYGIVKGHQSNPKEVIPRLTGFFIIGALLPILLLWYYQWQSFGNPFLPAQYWMPDTSYSDFGYQGFGLPQPGLLVYLLLDTRYGLFTTSPLILLGFAAPFVNRGSKRRFPGLEMNFIIGLFLGLLIFSSANNFAYLQFNTGLRYLAPLIPFLFILVSITLMRLPRWIVSAIVIVSVFQSWSMAMYRDVEQTSGVLNPVIRTMREGINFPVLETIDRFGGAYNDLMPVGISSLGIISAVLIFLFLLWSPLLLKKTQH